MKKRMLCLLVSLCLVLFQTAPAFAANSNAVSEASNGVVQVYAETVRSDGTVAMGVGTAFGVGTVGEPTNIFVTNRHVVTAENADGSLTQSQTVYLMLGANALSVTLRAVEEQFGAWLPKMKWINFGGGHHITRSDYDIKRLKRCICHMQETYGLEVYLEPGEAVALNAGTLLTEVLETMENGIRIAILDTSAACHMPDVLEMPYRPPLKDAGLPDEKPYTFRLAGPTCLAGDVIGDYSFDHRLEPGSRVVFEDMALYTMVKTNTFNGMPLPSIVYREKNGRERLVNSFSYEDFKGRL